MKKRLLALLLAMSLTLGLSITVSAADRSVRQIAGGNEFTFVVTNDGTLYACGHNSHDVFGPNVETTSDGSVSNVVIRPQKIAEGVKAVAVNKDNPMLYLRVSTGSQLLFNYEVGDHCLILMENGDLYAQGDNFYGQLGIGDSGVSSKREGMQYVMSGVAAIAAGDTFSVCVTKRGDLYWWGYIHQSGSNATTFYDRKDVLQPATSEFILSDTPVKIGSGFVDVDAGSGHIIALKKDGSVWTMGSQYKGACGDGVDNFTLREDLTCVFTGAVDVAAGSDHCMVLTESGDVYGWGDNTSHQVGIPIPEDVNNSYGYEFTTPVYVMGDAKKIAAGYLNSCVIKNNGDLWGMGHNYDGQLALGYTDYNGDPIKIATKVSDVAIGKKCIFMVKEDGSTYAAGNNYWYNFGNGNRLYNVLSWTAALLTASPIRDEGEMPFTDVNGGDYFYNSVQWALNNYITNGTSQTTFSPNDKCTRAQIITFLWRAAGSEAPSVMTETYKDVDKNGYYYSALRWCKQEPYDGPRICDPASDNYYFRPNDPCTRAEVVMFMWRYAGSPAYDTSGLPFTDVKANASYAQAVAWALDNGVTTGTSATTFDPNGTCTRGQIVTFLMRAYAE